MKKFQLLLPLTLLLFACSREAPPPAVDDAAKFLSDAEARLLTLNVEDQQADWIHENFITEDTEAVSAKADQRSIDESVRLAKEATRFDKLALPEDMARKMKLLKNGLVLATPSDPKLSEEATRLAASLDGAYGKGKYCPDRLKTSEKKCLDVEDITKIMATSNKPAELAGRLAWLARHFASHAQGFHALRRAFEQRRAPNWASRTPEPCGDPSTIWLPTIFRKSWTGFGIRCVPCIFRCTPTFAGSCTRSTANAVPANGPIPADLLGNIWAQDWTNIYKLVAPASADPGYDLTQILKSRNTKPLDMVKDGERFFTSLGFAPLPPTFWQRSLFTKPQDRDVVCHASAWDIDYVDDLRIKMCLDVTSEFFVTIHHELGHNFYQRAYDMQPFLFRDSANDGFHEAIGDTIALSVTPEYLVKIGLLPKAPDASKDIGLLLNKALEKIAFLPFGLMIDQWRWKVFSGEIPPDKYNQAWWDLRLKYQGVAPPVARSEDRLRSRREVSRRGERALYALLSGRYFAIPVSSRAGQGCRLPRAGQQHAAESLLDL